MKKRIPRVGVGGPVGSGKTALIEALVPYLVDAGRKVGIITNDIVTQEDAERMKKKLSRDQKIVPEELIIGLETGGCPHTAVREDPSMNISLVEEMEARHPDLDLIFIESGGDNLTLTFSPALIDYFIYVIDVAEGDKIIRKDGLGIKQSDLLIINKIDLAPYVASTVAEATTPHADLNIMRRDAEKMRSGKPFVFISIRKSEGVDEVVKHIRRFVLFEDV